MKLKQQLILALAIIVLAGAAVFILMSGSSKAATFDVKDGSLVISGQFGTTVPLSGISGLKLTDTMPAVGKKTNGAGLGSVYKGSFELADGTPVKLFVDAKKPPFITFTEGGTAYWLNTDTPDKTRALLEQIKTAVND